jgi:hypothetical protein
MGFNTIDLGNGESIEADASFWRDPERLRYAGERLKAKSAQPYHLMPVQQNPFKGGISDMLPDNHVAEDPSITEERERQYRTMRARAEIEAAKRNTKSNSAKPSATETFTEAQA